MKHLRAILLFLAMATAARAHVGNENNTEIRVFSDSMRVVLRTSLQFAWIVMGDKAPPMADEAGQAVAKPLLAAAAPELIAISAGGKAMSPTQVDCLFEPQNDVAFVLHFPRPKEWPVEVDARFFSRLSSVDTGMIEVFDYTASRFSRDLEPLLRKSLGQGQASVSFSLAAPEKAPEPPAPAPAQPAPPAVTPPAEQPGKVVLAVSLLVLAAVVIGWLAWRRWRAE